MSKDLFEQAATLAREHAQQVLSQKEEREQICYRLGRDTIIEALRSELEVISLLPLQEDATQERHAILAHLREWLAG